MEPPYELVMSLFAALAVGLLMGTERGWSDRQEQEGERIAGIRTFSIIGLLGGIMVLLSNETTAWLIVAGFASVSALIIVAHVLQVRKDNDVGTTTAFSMMLCFVLAAWAAHGQPVPAVAVTVIVISLLGYKPVLHSWLRHIQPRDFFAGIRLLIISLVLLPLLPDKGYGPWEALNPYWTWWMVVLISGLSFLGYVVIQLAGKKKGVLMTALFGGLASSTAVTISLARFAKQDRHNTVFAIGVVLASAIMFIRVIIEVAVVYPGLLPALLLPLGTMFAGLACAFTWLWYRQNTMETRHQNDIAIKNPLQLNMALQFALVLSAVLFLSEAMEEWFGSQGVYALAVVSGLIDVDAITLALSRAARQDAETDVAAMGIILACIANTVFKSLLFACISGFRKHFRFPVLILTAMIPGILVALAMT
ncbi:MAG: MgtC/SapB family protein [Pseudohongiellaceae bacterium]